MAGSIGRRIGGTLANQVAAGNVYNPYTGQMAPGGVQGARFGFGAAQQLGGPVGSLIGGIGNWLFTRNNPQAQAFDAGIRGWKGITQQFSQNQRGLGQWLQQQGRQGYHPNYAAPSTTGLMRSTGGISGLSFGPPQMGGYSGGAPSGPVGGVERGQFTPDARVSVPDADVGPIGMGPLTLNAGNGRSAPAGQMGGGMSGGTFTRGQADALTGDAARDYYAAMRMGSLFGVRQAGGDIRGNLYEK